MDATASCWMLVSCYGSIEAVQGSGDDQKARVQGQNLPNVNSSTR
jgi:hypothetical protein